MSTMRVRDKCRGNGCHLSKKYLERLLSRFRQDHHMHCLLTPGMPLHRLCRLCMKLTIQTKGLRQMSKDYYSKFQPWRDLWALSHPSLSSSIRRSYARKIHPSLRTVVRLTNDVAFQSTRSYLYLNRIHCHAIP